MVRVTTANRLLIQMRLHARTNVSIAETPAPASALIAGSRLRRMRLRAPAITAFP